MVRLGQEEQKKREGGSHTIRGEDVRSKQSEEGNGEKGDGQRFCRGQEDEKDEDGRRRLMEEGGGG